MDHVKLTDVIVPENRQRRQFDQRRLEELVTSILSKGLMHPIVVRNDGKTLVAGERRLRALTHIHESGKSLWCHGSIFPPGLIPVIRLADLDPSELEEAELEENTVRCDLTWQERAEAMARLHKLRESQAATRGEVQTIRATAEEIAGHTVSSGGGIAATVKNATILAPFLEENDPDVVGAKSEREAMSIAKRKLSQLFIGRMVENEQFAPPTDHTVVNASCITYLQGYQSSWCDCIITDPPYGINAHKMAPMSGSDAGQTHTYVDDLETAMDVWEAIANEGFRICKPDAALYMFCDFSNIQIVTQVLEYAGWDVWDRPIIWHKPAGGMLGNINAGPRRSYETIIYARKGNLVTTGTYLDVITMSGSDTSLHAAAKPPALYHELLRRVCLPGMHVLDPCCGSGPVFPAANALHLRATGIEVDPQHAATAKSRLTERLEK